MSKSRSTPQKALILNAVMSSSLHPTAQDVYDEVVKECSGISLKTVYRNLNQMSEGGIIRKISMPNAPDRFDKTLLSHYHIKCEDCGKFSDLPLEYAHAINESARHCTDFKVFEHEITFLGICPECRGKNE